MRHYDLLFVKSMHNGKQLTDHAKHRAEVATDQPRIPAKTHCLRPRPNEPDVTCHSRLGHRMSPRRGRTVNVTNRVPMQFDRSASSVLART